MKVMECKVVGGLGEKCKAPKNQTQYHQQDRVYQMGDISLCMPAELPGVSYNYLEVNTGARTNEPWTWEKDGALYLIRIRKLTPKECWRLMDFTDEDFEKAEKVNSNTQLYKQAGNSIVKNVLCEIFKQMM